MWSLKQGATHFIINIHVSNKSHMCKIKYKIRVVLYMAVTKRNVHFYARGLQVSITKIYKSNFVLNGTSNC